MTEAINNQVGGSHYKDLEIQPVQIAYSIGATPLWLKVCKYITRNKENPVEDLQKALHCIELENELMELRCQKYIAEMMPYDHRDIKVFSEQFKEEEFVYTVLHSMYFGYYKKAATEVLEMLGEAEEVCL